ncbi:MAG TPA: PfkB family carbohydrate kinase [Armatimonadota bacterium]
MRTASLPLFSQQRLEELLSAIATVRVGVVGDACLDVYWEADMTLSRLARENPHFIMPVVNERTSPGGGGNLTASVAGIGVQNVPLLGVVGDDWRGHELAERVLPRFGISSDYIVSTPERVTTAYCKPMRRGLTDVVYEDPHLYFENHAPMPPSVEAAVLDRLEALLASVDALVVADYLEYGVIVPAVRERLNRAAREGLPIVVDSRERIRLYRHAVLKPNDLEALWAFSPGALPKEVTLPRLEEIGRQLVSENAARVCITLGSQGCLWVEGDDVTLIPANPAPPPIDIVGAGDTFAAAFTTALVAGASGPEAAALANLASGVVVRKIGTTGTASPAEILQRYQEEFAS